MKKLRQLAVGTLILVTGGQLLLQAGCIGNIQRELEILWAPEASLYDLNNSILIRLFGPGVLQFW